ncbi:MAG: hypothetical protein ACFFEF_11130, partial [Candidatus Thorarchaeota archaeon]
PVVEFEFVSDEQRAKELDDTARLTILQILRRGVEDTKTTKTKDKETGDTIIRQREVKRNALSVVEIVKMSKEHKDVEEITKNQVYHHLPKLMEAGYIIELGKVITGKRETHYYRRTAKGFVLVTSMLGADEKMLFKKSTDYLDKLMKTFDIQLTEKEKDEIVKLRVEAYKKEVTGRGEVAKMIRSDVADKEVLDMFEFLVTMHAMASPEYIDLHKRMRDLLFKSK